MERSMAAEEATPSSQEEEDSTLDLPSVCDIRDYVLQRPSPEANSESLSSGEFHSFPCSSDVDPEEEALMTCRLIGEKIWPSQSNFSHQRPVT
ncbi:shieldin complex subunit 1 isoform X7 [Cynocephalus volans]|uniref:shieldin complex subunit 1 isoform X7 n=1 Tax=Cynocephalus volans TaxID=110931 RepID=UPI002FC60854